MPGASPHGPAAEGVGEAGRLPKFRARCAGGVAAAASGGGATAAERPSTGPGAEARRWAAPASPAAAVRIDCTAAAGPAGGGAAREAFPAGAAAAPDLRIRRASSGAQPEGQAVGPSGGRHIKLIAAILGAEHHYVTTSTCMRPPVPAGQFASILQAHKRTHDWDVWQDRVSQPARCRGILLLLLL